MTSAAESITESLRRTRQLMVQVCSYISSLVYLFFVVLVSWDVQLIYLLYLYVLIGGGKKCGHTHDFRYVLFIPISYVNLTLFDHNDTGLDFIFFLQCRSLYFR